MSDGGDGGRDAAEETRAWIALSLAAERDTGPWLQLALAMGSARAAVEADDAAMAAFGASPRAVVRLRRAWAQRSRRVTESCAPRSVGITTFASDEYPSLLRQLVDPPLVLYWRGRAPSQCVGALAVVGSRRCSDYGRRTAETIGREAAARGIVIVSGLARGVDAAAHRGALETGRTAAVLAGGLDRIYPAEHRSLAERIVRQGGWLMSEQPVGQAPRPWLFPHRNRILTGLALATVVVEAGRRSGSLASARHALAQGREVLAVPGPIDSALSEGTNALLRDGAAPYLRVEDLTAVSGLADLVSATAAPPARNIFENSYVDDSDATVVLAALERGPATLDALLQATALDGTRVLALLTALELAGLVQRRPAGAYGAVPRRRGAS